MILKIVESADLPIKVLIIIIIIIMKMMMAMKVFISDCHIIYD